MNHTNHIFSLKKTNSPWLKLSSNSLQSWFQYSIFCRGYIYYLYFVPHHSKARAWTQGPYKIRGSHLNNQIHSVSVRVGHTLYLQPWYMSIETKWNIPLSNTLTRVLNNRFRGFSSISLPYFLFENKLEICTCNIIIFIVIDYFEFKLFFTTLNSLVLKPAKTSIWKLN